MTDKIIILTSDDKVQTADYTDYKSLQNAVEGLIEHFNTLPNVQLVPIEPPIKIDMWCNDEFTYSDTESCKKINALATALNGGNVIYGNVALTVAMPYGESRGFKHIENEEGEEDICECWFMEDRLLLMRNSMEQDGVLKELHEQFDKQMESFSKKDVEDKPKTNAVTKE